MKEEGFWQMKFGRLKVCLVKVTMSIFTAKTIKYSHLVTPKNAKFPIYFNLSRTAILNK